MYTLEDKIKIAELLRDCQQFIKPRKLKAIPGNYAQLKEAALLQELAREVPKLIALFSPDAAGEALLKQSFLKLCAEREEHNQGTCMSYTAIPEGICNRLYLEIAVILFKPRHFGELIAILLPGLRASLTVELAFSQTAESSAASRKGEENLAVALKEEPLDAFAPYPAQSSMLTQVVTGDNVVFNLDAIANLPLLLREQFHRLLVNYPALKNKIYQHNDALQQLMFDLELLTKNGAAPGEMLVHLGNELSRAGTRYTGNVHAASSVTGPCAQFRRYLDQLPSELEEKLLALQSADAKHSLNSVLAHLANGNCVEEASQWLREILQNPANKDLLRNHPGTTREQQSKIRERYRKAIEIGGFESTNKLPEKLMKELVRNIKIKSAHDYLDLLLNLPRDEYLSFLAHASIASAPPLPAELASAMNMLNAEQTTAFFDALLAHKEKFGGLWEILFIAVKCNITKVFEKVFQAVPANQRLITQRGKYSTLVAEAAQNSNAEIVKILFGPLSVKERLEVMNSRTERHFAHYTPLHFAALNSNPEILRTLLNFLPDQERLAFLKKNEGSGSPLDLAINNSNPALFMTIRQCLSDDDYKKVITMEDFNDTPLLDKVVLSNNPENLKSLIAYLRQHNLMSILNRKSGRNILHTAAGCGNSEIVRILLAALTEQERKAMLSEKMGHRYTTPLDSAAHCNLEIYSIMMERLTEEERFTVCSSVNPDWLRVEKATPENWSLIWGLFKDKNKFASLFIEQRDGTAPLHWVSRNKHTEIWHDLWGALTAEQRAVFVKRKFHDTSLLQYLAVQSHFEAWSDVWTLHSDNERSAILAEIGTEGNTILHRVVHNNNRDVCTAILKYLSENNLLTALNIKNSVGNTPSHMAVTCNNSAFQLELLELMPAKERLKALKQKNRAGYSVLHNAATVADCWGVIWQLLPAGDRLSALREKNKEGRSPLHIAITNHSPATTMMLSPLSQEERTLVLSEKNSNNDTPLHLALQTGGSVFWRDVWEYMPDPLRLFEIKAKNRHGYTLLHLAAQTNKTELVAAILRLLPAQDRLAALTAVSEDGSTPLHVAVIYENEIVSCMLEYLPEQDHLSAIRMKNNYGNSVLHCSAKNSAEHFFALLQALPDGVRSTAFEETNNSGLNPVNVAITERNVDILIKMRELLSSKECAILLKTRDEQGNNSLHTASTRADLFQTIMNMLPEEERLLILNEKNKAGDTPLHSIARAYADFRWPDLWKFFTDKNQFASLFAEQKNDLEICPLHLAAQKNPAIWHDLWGALTANQKTAFAKKKIKDGIRLLHFAAQSISFEIWSEVWAFHSVQERLAAFAEKSADGATILHYAVCNPDLRAARDIAQLMSENKLLALLTEKKNDGNTPLHGAINKPNCLSLLLELIPPPQRLAALTLQNKAGNAPLHHLAASLPYHDCWEVIGRLLPVHDRLSALIEKNKSGCTCLHLLVKNSVYPHTSFIIIWNLLSEEERIRALNEKDSFGSNLLHYSVNAEIGPVIWKSLPRQSGILRVINRFGNTPLHKAAGWGSFAAMVEHIPAEERLVLLIKVMNQYGDTPLHVAVRNNNIPQLRLALQSLSQSERLQALKARNRAGSTVLHCAAETKHITNIEFIVGCLSKEERLLLVTEKNKFGQTPLDRAAKNKNFVIWSKLWSLLSEEEQSLAREVMNQPAPGRTKSALFQSPPDSTCPLSAKSADISCKK